MSLLLITILLWWVGGFMLITFWLHRRDLLPAAVDAVGPFLVLYTTRTRTLVDRLARPRWMWLGWGIIGILITFMLMVGTGIIVILAAGITVVHPSSGNPTGLQNILAIPGFNEYLPLAVGPVVGIVVAFGIHEAGHALMGRADDITFDEVGLVLLTLVPIGGIVTFDAESRDSAGTGAQLRMLSAGVTHNAAATVLAFGLLIGPVTGLIGVAPGVAVGGVQPGSPAAQAGIQQGDRLIAINGRPIEDVAALQKTFADFDTREFHVRLVDADTGTERMVIIKPVGQEPTVDAIGLRPYPAARYLRILRGGTPDRPVVEQVASLIGLPLGATVEGSSFAFPGFTGAVANFYVVTAPGALSRDVVFLVANILYWVGWLNLNFAMFNALPALPLDGGRLLRIATAAIAARLPISNRYQHDIANSVTDTTTLLTGLALLLLLIGPVLRPFLLS